jgi:hypothetical protein
VSQNRLQALLNNKSTLNQLPPSVKAKIFELVEELEERKSAEQAQKSFMAFVQKVWPAFIHGAHHAKMAEAFEKVAEVKIKRLIINMPPRHGKSMLASEYFPAWYLGRNPRNQVIAATYSQDLATGFGRKVRNQLIDPMYHSIFRSRAADDSASASQVMTDKGGVYNAIGVGGSATGRAPAPRRRPPAAARRSRARTATRRRRSGDSLRTF